METGVIFYEMDPPYIYEDIVQHRFYVVAAEIRTRMYILRDHPFHHPIDTPQFNPDMPYEFPLQWLHPDAPFHPFHDGPVPHQHPDQPADQADPEPEPMEEHFPEPVPEEDIPMEQISVSSSEPSSEEPLTASISGPASAGQTSSTSASAPPEIIEISDDEDKDPEECSDVVVISSDDDS
ncbi:uncharacterized protein DS421_17g596390 [Arachis hypogaea]|nr:uncharacterized protein DS421_17g596390 [Arachis hypogaea]